MAAALLVLILPAFSGCLGGSGDAPGPSATDGAGDAPTLPEGLEMEGADVVSYNETRVTWRWQDAIGPGYCCADESTSNAAVTTFDVPRDIPLMVVATLSWDPDGTPARYVAVRDEGGHQVCGRAQYLTLAGAESPPLTCGGEVPRLDAQSTWSVYVDQTANHHPAKPFTVHLTLAVDLADDTTFMFEEPARVADQVHPNEQESFIMVSPDGQTILTCQHGEFQEPSPMFASTDGGETFRRLEAPPDAAVGGDCDVALDEDGTWYFLSSTVAGATVLATDDEGATWDVVNPLAAVPVNGMADRP